MESATLSDWQRLIDRGIVSMLSTDSAPAPGWEASAAHLNRDARRPRRSSGTWFFLGLLVLSAVACLALIAYRASVPRDADEYGLVPTGDVAADAKAFLAAARAQSLPSQTLAETRAAGEQRSPLVGKTAPDFDLSDTEGHQVALRDLRRDGPVIVVFYYGYYCSHCVAQLFGLEADLPKFAEHGVHIVALSADPPETTAARFRQYGHFHFPVLSDRGNKIAEQYGVYTPSVGDRDQDLKHGTFVVDQSGRIVWGYAGYQPFVDNGLLLKLAAEHRAPSRR
jgi:thioredoxin-dependent peroxiredoxin